LNSSVKIQQLAERA